MYKKYEGRVIGDDLKKMNDMYMRDSLRAWFDVALLWIAVIFVVIVIFDIVKDEIIRLVLYQASFMLMLFKTASVFAMTKHFKEDKYFIYGLDIEHLDVNRAAKK